MKRKIPFNADTGRSFSQKILEKTCKNHSPIRSLRPMQSRVQLTHSIENLSLNELIWLLQHIVKVIQQKVGKTEQTTNHVTETALLSEPALAEDWNKPEEDEAWSHLQ
ncbi:hypothetical protein QUF58_12805 [Anaerolineales bacterium HSG24]|nr:hypothetical protein [Anaerolineales bacterium HSG24]